MFLAECYIFFNIIVAEGITGNSYKVIYTKLHKYIVMLNNIKQFCTSGIQYCTGFV